MFRCEQEIASERKNKRQTLPLPPQKKKKSTPKTNKQTNLRILLGKCNVPMGLILTKTFVVAA